MTTQLDSSIGLKKESVFGTGVTVDSFPEFVKETLDRKAKWVQGAGLKVGKRVARSNRRVLGEDGAEGSITLEAATRGLGIFLEAAFGAVTSNGVPSASGAYQHVFTPAPTDPMPSYTIQKGIPPVGGGVTTAMTFNGSTCTKVEFTAKAGDIVEVSTDWQAREVVTNVAYATPSYAATTELLAFVHGAIVVGGTLTAPTTTALASSTASAAANVVDVSLTFSNGLDGGTRTLGGAGKVVRKPILGMAEISGKMTVEYDATTLRDAYLNQTDLALVLTFTHTTTIGTGTPVPPVLQLVVPVIRLEGELPKASNGEAITQDISFTGLDGQSAASPIYAVYRSLDATPL